MIDICYEVNNTPVAAVFQQLSATGCATCLIQELEAAGKSDIIAEVLQKSINIVLNWNIILVIFY